MKELITRYGDVQLATLVDKPPQGGDWLHEIKFDGYRLIGVLEKGSVKLYTRNGNDWTPRFPSISSSILKLKAKSAVIDMEAVVVEPSGRTNFGALQNALGDRGNTDLIVAYVFDILYLDSKDVGALPQIERKEILASLLKKSKTAKYLHYSEHVLGKGDAMLAKSCTLGLEGIVSKRTDARYQTGRQKTWLKSKCITRQEFIIVGYSGAKKGDRAIGALYLGYLKDGKMAYAGKVGTGFTMSSAVDIYKKLAKLETKTPSMAGVPRSEMRHIHWVKPSLLCEVAFGEWTADGHIRHASFQGLREDKKAKEVKRETPVPVEKVAKASAAPRKKAGPAKKSKAVSDEKVVYQGVTISHPKRIIDTETGLTKGGLAAYYSAVAPYLLKCLSGHPVTLIRCPDGIGGETFYQRNPNHSLPDVVPFKWKHDGKAYEYFYTQKASGVLEMVQMSTIEFHPWGTRYDNMDCPDWAVFDLDPDPSVPFEAVKLAALDLRHRLERKGLKCFLRVTGGKGLHVVVPLAGKDRWPEVKEWCATVAKEMVSDVPDAYIATMSKAKRHGKIFIDFFRNDYNATAVADFSVRARPGAPVAVPLEWKELKALKAGNQFSVENVLKRLKKKPPDETRYKIKQRIPKRAKK